MGADGIADAELFADTRDFDGPGTGYQQCQNTMTGSSVPKGNRELFTDFQRCMVKMTVPGVLEVGSDILLVKASFNSRRDKESGKILAVQLFFEDDNGVNYQSDLNLLTAPFVVADAQGYVLKIDKTVAISPQGGKNKESVGDVCVDEVIYEPLP